MLRHLTGAVSSIECVLMQFFCNLSSPTEFHCPTKLLRQIKGIRWAEGWLGAPGMMIG